MLVVATSCVQWRGAQTLVLHVVWSCPRARPPPRWGVQQVWDPADARWEREWEKQQRQKAEAARQAAADAEAAALQLRLAALAANEAAEQLLAAAAPSDGPQPAPADAGAGTLWLLPFKAVAPCRTSSLQGRDTLQDSEPLAAGLEGVEVPPPDRKRRRRAEVDYKALDEKLRAEEGAMQSKPV